VLLQVKKFSFVTGKHAAACVRPRDRQTEGGRGLREIEVGDREREREIGKYTGPNTIYIYI